ncbi:hypothetical protein BGZ95_006299, partial [Linnemannia exigua]
VENEPIPDFSNPDSWYNIKLLVAGGDSDQRVKSRTTALNSKTKIDSTAAVMRTCEPYLVERDLITPPLELQRLLFPWIEHSFDLDDPGKTHSWILECDQEMKGVDETVITEDDIHWEARFQHSTAQESASGPDWTANRLTSSAQVDRIAFLKLLIRMRRVILKDAVLYLTPDSKGRTLDNSLFTSLPHIFDSPMFMTFKSDLLQAMESHRQNSTLVSPFVLIDKQDVSNALNNLSNQVTHAQTSLGNQVSQVQAALNQVSQVQAALAQNQRTQQEQIHRMSRPEHEIKHRLCNLAILPKLHPKHRLATPKRQHKSRRNEFVSMIKEAAEAEGRLPEELVEEWTETYQGQTINSIREIIKAKKAKKVVRETPKPVPAEETHIEARS